MARYIDADKFIKQFERALEHQQKYGLYNHAKITEYVIKAIENEPTADVVPKSDYDELKQYCSNREDEVMRLMEANDSMSIALNRAKTKVAREIFEAIDDIKKAHAMGDINDYWLYVRLKELKNKYIGEQK